MTTTQEKVREAQAKLEAAVECHGNGDSETAFERALEACGLMALALEETADMALAAGQRAGVPQDADSQLVGDLLFEE